MTRRWVVLLSLATALLVSFPALARQAISLDGDWECVFGDVKLPPAADASWEPITVPSPRVWNSDGPHTLWHRKSIYLPPGWAGQRIILTLIGAKFSQRVLLNGKEVGKRVGGFGPFEYDLTNQAQLGQANTLLIATQDWTSLIAPGAKVEMPEPGDEFGAWVVDGLLAPLGAQGWEVGITGDVTIDARPRVWVAGVQAISSVRQRTLRIDITLKNASVSPERTEVTARIGRGGGGPHFSSQFVTTAPGETKTLTMEESWPTARVWSPDDPHLYSVIVGARTGAIGDSVEARFGFREFWVEGDRCYLNGAPINLLATASLPLPDYNADPAAVYDAAQAAGCVAMALVGEPWPEQWYDVADEQGMLLVSESALWGMGASYALAKDEFWRNAQDQLGAQVSALRNHPSVVIWSAEGELLYTGGAKVGGAEQKVAGLAEVIRKADPTRPVMFEGDGDPGGKADIVNLHFPHEFARWPLWPETAYWLDTPIRPDTYPAGTWRWDHRKPLYLGAFGWGPLGDVNAASVILGDAAYPDTENARDRASAAVWEAQIAAARDAGVDGISPWSMWEAPDLPSDESEAQTRAYQPVAVVVREASTHAFAGAVVDRTIMAFNDSESALSLDARWRLAPADGAWEVTGHAPVTLDLASRQRVQASLALPPLDAEVTPAEFSVELWDGDRKMASSTQVWKVYGRPRLAAASPAPPKRVAIYDPAGETTSLLSALGVGCLALDAANARRYLHFMPLAVVGKGAFEARPADAELLTALSEYVTSGGSVLVFEQTAYPAELIPAALTNHDSSIAFPRAVGHPALTGIEAGDLSHWLPDGVVGRKEVAKLAQVGFLPIVDSGSGDGPITAGLAELRVGDGRFILCQLDLTAKVDVDPVATRIFRNLLAYGATHSPRPATTGVFASDAAAAALDAVGLKYDRLRWPLPKGALLRYDTLLVCDLDTNLAEPGRLSQFVAEGGRALLHEISPETLALAQRLTGQPFGLGEMTDGMVALDDRSGPAVGLSNQELAWFTPVSPTGGATPELSTGIADFALRESGEVTFPMQQVSSHPVFHTLPGLLVSSRFGRGQWVLDQVKWEQAGPNEDEARRYLATLLTNLGCAAKR